ncbi:hypothetical protein [Heyndrickxia coagulans]|uniref:hypothetical protein n=1 Tax=Heyndrickxia coagulans TaxID=1398 RepID=UPI00035F1E8B|nr:hypothetical protein [Heyndrickxia coagulans]MED4942389.1 hypothetical protein [Heyndrickxia coagulans]MED4965225.1 hypothetical protein [Heyndrickxia coagulans]
MKIFAFCRCIQAGKALVWQTAMLPFAGRFFSWTVVFYILCLHMLDDYLESLIKPDFFARFCRLASPRFNTGMPEFFPVRSFSLMACFFYLLCYQHIV